MSDLFGPPEREFVVQKWALVVPVSDEVLGVVGTPPRPYTRRQEFRWWRQDVWSRRPRVHFGPCDHDGCG